MLNKLIARIKKWRRKREWNAELQLYHLQVMVQSDARWMAHNPIVSELTERYLKMLADDWEKQPQEDVSQFRRRIGLEPPTGKQSHSVYRGHIPPRPIPARGEKE